MIDAKVTGIKPIGAGKVAQIGFDVNGAIETRKAWATEKDGSPTWVEGETYTIEFEEKPAYNDPNTMEKWAKKSQAPRAGGRPGGGAKPDPERNQIEKEKVEVEKAKQEQFERKWEIDRQSDKWKNCSIVAQVAAKIAQDITVTELTTIGGDFDPNKFKAYVSDIAHAIDATTTELYSVQTAQAGRSGQ